MKKKLLIPIIAFVFAFLLSSCSAEMYAKSNQPASSLQPEQIQDEIKTVQIGVLVPQTGVWSTPGIAEERALKIGLPYVNSYLQDYGIQIALDIRDTKSDPAEALSELISLDKEGINTVIFGASSEEATNLLQYATDNNILLLSPSATSMNLSRQDNFFRVVSTDTSQVDGLTRIMKNVYKIDCLIPIYIDDTYGRGYDDLLRQMSAAQGMEIIGSVPISPNQPDYVSAASALQDLSAAADSEDTAVVIISTPKIASELIEYVSRDEKLSSMKWFASADIIGDQNILQDRQVAQFFEKTGMEGLTFGYKGISLDALPYVGSVLEGAADYSPFAITAWDALWLLADTYGKAPNADFDTLKQNLLDCAGNYRNAFGTFNTMDENGDTKGSKYMRYVCIKENGSYIWRCKGHYVSLGAGEPIIQTIDWEIAPDAGEVLVGVLLPLTGNHSEKGKEIATILYYAEENFNRYAKECGSGLRLKLVVKDTASDPLKAEAAAKELIDMGVQTIIGPINSPELVKVKPLIDAAGIIDISPISTSPSLGVKDRVYRLILNDRVQVKALSELMHRNGIEKVVVVNTNDTYGNEIASLMKENYQGDVILLPYDPAVSAYSPLLSQVDEAVKSGDKTKTAIMAVSNDEIAQILRVAAAYSSLKEVRWYGTDGSALSNVILSDQKALEMAINVDFTALDYTPYGKNFDPLYYVVNDIINPAEPLKESSISAFDGLWLLGCAYLQEGSAADIETVNAYVSSKSFRGLGGVINLDENGDRQFGYYKFYHIKADKGKYSWQDIGVYSQDFVRHGVLEMYQ